MYQYELGFSRERTQPPVEAIGPGHRHRHVASGSLVTGQRSLTGAAAFTGTMLAFIAFLERGRSDVGGIWVVWSTGLAVSALARGFFRRHPAAAGGVEARHLP